MEKRFCFTKTLFHGGISNLVARIAQVPDVAGQVAWHGPGRDHADGAFPVEYIRAKEELL
jgi:hypothetical protein